MSVYDKQYEIEADYITNPYFELQRKDKGNLINISKKLNFTRLCSLQKEDTKLYPDFEERINRVKNMKILTY